MFSVISSLCARFPALSPFSIRRERFRDAVAVYIDAACEAGNRTGQQADAGEKPPDDSFMIGDTLYMPAQNDDWW